MDIDVKKDVEMVGLDELIPYHNNPKEHPSEQIEKIASSIKTYGFTVPMVVDSEGEIIAGHGRYYASQELELEEVPVIRRDDLSEAQVKAFRIADNKVTESDWDEESLTAEFEMLEEENFELSLTGFDLEELEGYLIDESEFEGGEHNRPEFDDDEFDQGSVEDSNWFFITYYGQEDRFVELKQKLEEAGAMDTGHEIDPDVFEEILEAGLDEI